MFDIDATLAIEFRIAVITEFGVGVGFSTQPSSPGVTLDEFLAPHIFDRRSVDHLLDFEITKSIAFIFIRVVSKNGCQVSPGGVWGWYKMYNINMETPKC